MRDETHCLFVYGSLAPGRTYEHVLSALGGTWQAGMVKGYLELQGWGAQIGYPGLVLDEGGEEIQGYIFSSDGLAAFWEELDDFEGEQYQRVMAKVYKDDGSSTRAHVYVLRLG